MPTCKRSKLSTRLSAPHELLGAGPAAFLIVGTLLFVGCAKPPPLGPLALDQIKPTMQEAFANADPRIKGFADQVVGVIEQENYATAHALLQNLTAMPNLSDDQREVASRVFLAVTEEMEYSAESGDEAAAQSMQIYRMAK